jgi:hypothetical protein
MDIYCVPHIQSAKGWARSCGQADRSSPLCLFIVERNLCSNLCQCISVLQGKFLSHLMQCRSERSEELPILEIETLTALAYGASDMSTEYERA